MSCGLPVPGPAEDFTVRSVTTEEVEAWYHVYSTAAYPATATSFAEGWGDTRFAPLAQDDGTPVHTYYAASTRDAVYMESVLHNVSLSPPGVFEVTCDKGVGKSGDYDIPAVGADRKGDGDRRNRRPKRRQDVTHL